MTAASNSDARNELRRHTSMTGARFDEVLDDLLASVREAAKAEALREAANDIIPDEFRSDPELCRVVMDPWDVAEWLLARGGAQ